VKEGHEWERAQSGSGPCPRIDLTVILFAGKARSHPKAHPMLFAGKARSYTWRLCRFFNCMPILGFFASTASCLRR